MGLLPDSRGLYPRLTPREHIRYFGELHGLSGRRARTSASKRLIRRLGLEQIADRRVAGFSQGERTKVALARALVHEPRNVILDEPTNGLDVMSTRAVRELIRGLRQDGCCVRVLEPHHAGSLGAVRSHRRHRAGDAWWPTARPTNCAGRRDATISRTRSCRWPGSTWRPAHDACFGDRGRVPEGAASTAVAIGGRSRRSLFSAVIAPILFGVMFTVTAERRKNADEHHAAGRRRGVRAGVRRVAEAADAA